MTTIETVAQAVKTAAERETNGNLRAYAAKIDVPYDALYALANGLRKRSVDADTLIKLSIANPEVAALFVPAVSQNCNG